MRTDEYLRGLAETASSLVYVGGSGGEIPNQASGGQLLAANGWCE